MYSTKHTLCRDTQMFSDALQPMMGVGGNFLKRISTYLHCTKYSEINIRDSSVQKLFCCVKDINSLNILHTGEHKSFPIHYRLWGKIF